jgi:hypothetical protein
MNDLRQKLQEYLDKSTPEELRAEIDKRPHLQAIGRTGFQLIQPPHIVPLPEGQPSIFLAGSITGEDWQSYVVSRLCGFGNITIVNPRPKTFDLTFEDIRKQSMWSHEYLDMVDQILFWFDVDTHPTTLLEFGIRLREYRHRNYVEGLKPQPMFIGYHPLYANKYDVFEQARLEGYRVLIAQNLEDLIVEVLEFNRLKRLIS